MQSVLGLNENGDLRYCVSAHKQSVITKVTLMPCPDLMSLAMSSSFAGLYEAPTIQNGK